MNDPVEIAEKTVLTREELCGLASDVMRHLPHFFFVLSVPDYTFTYLNPAALGMLGRFSGLGQANLLGHSAPDVIPDWEGTLSHLYQQVSMDGRPMELTRLEVSVRGERRFWDMFLFPIKDGEDSVGDIATLAVDVTSHVGMARTQTMEFWTTFRESPIGIAVLDVDGRIQNGNPALTEMLGQGVERLHHAKLGSLVHPEDTPDYEYCMSMLREAHAERCERELRLVSADGAVVYVDMVISIVRGVWGKPRYLLAMIQNITARRIAQAELREARDLLEHQVRSLQRALLPGSTPQMEGYDVAVTYQPAFKGKGELIGGDFYDIFRTEGGKYGILIGDVSGKGIEAASLAATARSTLRAFAYDSSLAAESVGHTNRLLASQSLPLGQFATAFLAILDPDTGGLCYTSAGHPEMLIRRAGGELELLGGHSLPVSVIAEETYDESESSLQPGDTLVLFTDGVLEAKGERGLFDEEGVRETVRTRGAGAGEIVESLLSAVREWSGNRLNDDIAIVAVHRRGDVPQRLI